eukprot:409247-Rhodomonas_salina.1
MCGTQPAYAATQRAAQVQYHQTYSSLSCYRTVQYHQPYSHPTSLADLDPGLPPLSATVSCYECGAELDYRAMPSA